MVPPQETKWTHAPFSGHESRCCSFCNKWAKTTCHVGEEWSDCDGIRAVSGSSMQRHAGIQEVTAAARPTEPVAAACTAWDAAAAGDAKASEMAR